MTEYPFYPTLPEEAGNEAQKLIDQFKEKMSKVATETIESLYVDVVDFIESDSWGNFRNQIMDGFKNYNNSKIHKKYDFKAIRAEIYKEFREDIISDLNQDIFQENESLKKMIKHLESQLSNRNNY